ncbi:glutathione S-transferase [Pontixanthobacter gangjinensis]|uniref:Glutathione S-transferase n=1 Tax=Pontixanthobacter gangjinensis TaxID=1028742 RepID=A0A6I4SPV6_9SPHN|nr:glutathione S-transferase family protein [Pontixanthobacter gangjinensis]MXO57845.1 glutathione S-transferase [Pontixanthobacter gangjinensis]
MSLTFYDCKTAPSPRRARIILAEKGVPHELVEIDLRSAEQMGEAYRAINPNATVPALKLEDGTVLTDNAGIAAWLEAAYPDPPLMGISPLEKADIATWQWRVEQEFGMGVASALRNANPAMKGRALPGPHDYEQIPALAERGMQQVDHFFDRLDAHLEGREFIAADRLSVADVTGFVFMDFAKVIGKRPGEEYSNIARWREGLRERPAFQL